MTIDYIYLSLVLGRQGVELIDVPVRVALTRGMTSDPRGVWELGPPGRQTEHCAPKSMGITGSIELYT